MIQVIANMNGSIVSTNNNLFKPYRSIFEIGFKENFFELTSSIPQILLINFFQKNYIVQNLRMNLNETGLVYFLFEEYGNSYLSIDNDEINPNPDLYSIGNFDSTEQTLMFALRNGYLQDKEIYLFFENISGEQLDLFKIQYTVKRLYKKFDVSTRSELLRKVYFYKLDRHFPKDLFKPGIYDSRYQQLQLL